MFGQPTEPTCAAMGGRLGGCSASEEGEDFVCRVFKLVSCCHPVGGNEAVESWLGWVVEVEREVRRACICVAANEISRCIC